MNTLRPVAADAALHFVLNGAAGSQDDDSVQAALDDVLGAAGRRFELHRAPQPAALQATAQHAARLAAEAGGVLVSVGGDGTLNTVMHAAMEAGVTVGLVPRGTFNYVARNHAIPLDVRDAVALLLQGQAQPVQVGRVNGRRFLVNASLGMYPELLEDREQFKRRYGRNRVVALWAALASLLRRHRSLALHVQADGRAPRDVKASTLFVGNNALQMAALGLPEEELPGGHQLLALVLRTFTPGEQLWLAVRGAFGRLDAAENVTHFAFGDLAVRPRLPLGRKRVKVAVDGEIVHLPPPLHFTIDPDPLWMIQPAPAPGPDGPA